MPAERSATARSLMIVGSVGARVWALLRREIPRERSHFITYAHPRFLRISALFGIIPFASVRTFIA